MQRSDSFESAPRIGPIEPVDDRGQTVKTKHNSYRNNQQPRLYRSMFAFGWVIHEIESIDNLKSDSENQNGGNDPESCSDSHGYVILQLTNACQKLHNGWRICGELTLPCQKVTGSRSARTHCESAKCACYAVSSKQK